MSAETKACRHCGEPILAKARVCKHCSSNQAWLFASQRDPRFRVLLLLLSLPIFVVLFLALRDLRAKLDRTFGEGACRGQVELKSTVHALRKIDLRDRLFIRVQIENHAQTDVSEPTIRVEVLDATDTVIDAFQRTIYGVTIEPGKSHWFRVDGDLTADVSTVADVHVELSGAECKSTWH
jgi:hypothetical protein